MTATETFIIPEHKTTASHMPRRKPEHLLAIGAAAQVFGAVLLVLGSLLPVGQLVVGTKLEDADWLLFVIVSGFGFALLLVGRALGLKNQVGPAPSNGYQAAGETVDSTQEYVGDGDAGD